MDGIGTGVVEELAGEEGVADRLLGPLYQAIGWSCGREGGSNRNR